MWRRLGPLLGAVLFSASVWVLRREILQVGFPGIAASLAAVPVSAVALAVALTALNYLVLTWHDRLAFWYARIQLSSAQIGLASFVGYAISNNLGFAVLSGSSARYRFYPRWGLTPTDLSRVVLFYSVTFWLGLCVLGGTSLLVAPPAGLEAIVSRPIAAAAGALALALVVAYAGLCLWRRHPISIGRTLFALPDRLLLSAQIGVSTLDWLLAVAVMFVLLPHPRPSFLTVAGAVTVAQLVGLVSHVPGGLGVFEGLIMLFLRPHFAAAALVPVLIAYRVIYYLLPLASALVILLLDETFQRRRELTRWSRTCRMLAVWAAPKILAVFTFACGAVLLFSGATPAIPARLAWLARVMPLPLLEASHFSASLAGLLLLLLAQAVAARVDAAYYLTAGALAVGCVASLLKGGDYEEAILLALVLGALVAGRRHFTRRARILERPLSRGWLTAVGIVVAASVWLALFAYAHVAYRNDLWWQFAIEADAPRSLRALVAVTIVALAVGIRQLLRPAPPPAAFLEPATMVDVDRVIASQTRTMPNLVYLGDKSILWNGSRTAFVMYASRGRSCIALGDPVGPPSEARALVRRFLQVCYQFALTPVFYETSRQYLHDYADVGLTAIKIGEEAQIRLRDFSLQGSACKPLRAPVNRIDREGYTFRVVQPADVLPLLPELAEVSDEWLDAKNASEKRFSLGFFDEEYLPRFPVALIERHGRIEAFANLWPGPGRIEISPDLMRHRTTAPPGIMDGLFVKAMLWARDEDYEWFNLGMAPLSGLEPSYGGWTRLGHFIYRHGEAFYNFQGLRAYKEKFCPVWQPRYLVYPGGLALARVLADATSLIGGGYAHLFRRSKRRVA
jgi:phosphatidylglycerol lysyltransferase